MGWMDVCFWVDVRAADSWFVVSPVKMVEPTFSSQKGWILVWSSVISHQPVQDTDDHDFVCGVWGKIEPPGDRRFWSMFPLTRVPFWYRFFDPQPHFAMDGSFCEAADNSSYFLQSSGPWQAAAPLRAGTEVKRNAAGLPEVG